MRDRTIARNYAEALFELTAEESTHGATLSAFETLRAVLRGDVRIRAFLETPKIPASEKKAVLARVLEDRAPSSFVNFVRVVIDQGRQGLLDTIAEEYRARVDEAQGRLKVEVTLAREPDDAQRDAIAATLSRKLDKSVVPQVRVNPNILGGIVVRFGDRVMDSSLKRQLATLRRRMLEADLPLDAASDT